MAISQTYAYFYILVLDHDKNFRVLKSGENGVGPNPLVSYAENTLTLQRVSSPLDLLKKPKPQKTLRFDLAPIAQILTANTAIKLRHDPGHRSIEVMQDGMTILLVGELTHQDTLEFEVDYEQEKVSYKGRELPFGQSHRLGDYDVFIESVQGFRIGHGYRATGWIRHHRVPESVSLLSSGAIR